MIDNDAGFVICVISSCKTESFVTFDNDNDQDDDNADYNDNDAGLCFNLLKF